MPRDLVKAKTLCINPNFTVELKCLGTQERACPVYRLLQLIQSSRVLAKIRGAIFQLFKHLKIPLKNFQEEREP